MGMPPATTGLFGFIHNPKDSLFQLPGVYIAIVYKLVPCLLSEMESVSRSSVTDQRKPSEGNPVSPDIVQHAGDI